MEYYHIVNFQKYQHYKARHITSWIKLYYAILDDYKFSKLKMKEKWVFIGFLLLAGKTENNIPNDLEWIQHRVGNDKNIDEILKSLQTEGLLNLGKVYTESTPKRVEESRVEEKRIDNIYGKQAQRLCGVYKDLKDLPKVDKYWWGRNMKSAVKMVNHFAEIVQEEATKKEKTLSKEEMGDKVLAVSSACVRAVKDYQEKRNLDWKLETCVNMMSEWQYGRIK